MSLDTPKNEKNAVTEIDASQQSEVFKKLTIENPATLEAAKDILNLVKDNLDKNAKKMDGTKINIYIKANLAFQKAIGEKQTAYTEKKVSDINTTAITEGLKDLMSITEDMQKIIDKKILDDLGDIQKEANTTKKEMIKNFSAMTTDDIVKYTKKVSKYTNNLENYKDNKTTETQYKTTKTTIDDIQKIIDLTKLDKTVKKDRLLELQTFLITSDFIEGEKKSLNTIITNLLPNAEKGATEKIAEASTLDSILSKTPSDEVAKELFETNESAWNALMEKKGVFTNTNQKANFNALITLYVKKLYPNTTIATAEFQIYEKTQKKYIQATNNKGETVKIILGLTSDAVYQADADNYEGKLTEERTSTEILTFKDEKINFKDKKLTAAGAAKAIEEVITMTNAPKKINIINGTTTTEATKVIIGITETYVTTTDFNNATTKPLTINSKIVLKEGEKIEIVNVIGTDISNLDVIGSYREFEDIIDTHKTDKVVFLKQILGEGILEAIDTNAHGGIDQNTKKNGYYGIIIEQIAKTKDEGLLSTYLGNIISGNTINVKYLGTDNNNQLKNFAKLKKDWVIDPKSTNGIALAKIQLQLAQGVDKKTFQETLSQGLDAMINAFGPMLFNILKLFGFNKNKLAKLFGSERIDKMYQKEYGLSKNAIAAVKGISDEFKTSEKIDPADTGEEIETGFEKKKTEYIKTIRNGSTTVDGVAYRNYTFLNVSTLTAGLKTFNKDLNINDVVTITTDSTTGKQSITGIKKDIEDKNSKTDAFTGAMKSILDDDATWTKIATANTSIKTPAVEDKKTKEYNEQGLSTTKVKTYDIDSKYYIARYLTASLFSSSSKDLSFVMTENKLNDGVVETKQKNTIKLDIDTTTYATEKDGIYTLKGISVTTKIADIFTTKQDATNGPKQLKITTITGTIKTLTKEKINDVRTYTDPDTKVEVIINAGDTLEGIAEKKDIAINEKRTTLNSTLNATTQATDKKSFEANTYKLDPKNTYETQIANLSALFTTEADYKNLIGTTDNSKTLTDMVTPTNMDHLKNMLTYWGLKKTDNKDIPYTNMTLTDLTSKIDTTKQTYTVTATSTDGIKIDITTTSGNKKEGTITITNTDGKLTTTRIETPAVVAKT